MESLSQHLVFFYSVTFIIGLCVGSFLNVVVHRLPLIMAEAWLNECKAYLKSLQTNKPPFSCPACDSTKQEAIDDTPSNTISLSLPRSHCPGCKAAISWYDNIPVLSYLFLKRKCRHCQTTISLRYPIVELLAGLLALFSAITFGPSVQFLFASVFCLALLGSALIDLDTQLLPDSITYPVLWLGLLANTQNLFTTLYDATLGAIVGYMLIWSIVKLHFLVTRREGMGMGDFKLFALLGAWFGWQCLPFALLLSSLTGALTGLLVITLNKKSLQTAIPFGPHIIFAGLVVLFGGDTVLEFLLP